MSFFLIGSAPSSGSTLLADLLDSSNFSACGEETKIFANKHIYNNFEYFKANFEKGFRLYTVHNYGKIYFHFLCKYGINLQEFKEILTNSSNVKDFVKILKLKYLAFRGKKIDGILFEKTPENLNALNEFLQTFNSYFIAIVRNPLYVYKSLKRRGFPDYIALLTWLVDNAKLVKYKNNEKVLIIKYEDLVNDPFETVSDIFKQIGFPISAKKLKKGYLNNNYKKYCSIKLKEWRIKDFGKIRNANTLENINKKDLENFGRMMNVKITKNYANFFDIKEISFKELCDIFNYKIDYIKTDKIITPTTLERKWILNRWKFDLKNNEATEKDKAYYINIIEKVNTP